MLKSLGFLCWISCLLTLAYQAVYWVLFKSWPALDMFTVLRNIFGLDLVSVAEALPLDTVAKLLYVALTTELSLFLWWSGTAFFILLLVTRLARK